jgi:hypothetical protein
MSQPRRRRRRRRKPGGEGAQKPRPDGQQAGQVREQASDLDGSRGASSRSRNRRRRRRGAGPGVGSPKSSEDLVRALPKDRPAQLTAPPDGQSLDKIIGELQSNYGVPAYPQEYRITIKVADEKGSTGGGGSQPAPPKVVPAPEGAPKREKAPAAPRVDADGSDEAPGAERPGKRKRSRRRRGRGRSGSNGSTPPGAPPPPPPA